jgi:hypothetical protein
MNNHIKSLNKKDLKINLIGENDNYRFKASFLSRRISNFTDMILLSILITHIIGMLSNGSDLMNSLMFTNDMS